MIVSTPAGAALFALAGGDGTMRRRALEGRHVSHAVARGAVILAGTLDGIFRSADGGATWAEASDGLAHRHVRWMAMHPDVAGLALAGTEPAAIFVSRDDGLTWVDRPEVEVLREAHGWFLPYSPEAGCVRGFALRGERGYAAVEVGGVLRSDDAGGSWRLAGGSAGEPTFGDPGRGRVAADVHSVALGPASAEVVYAATDSGTYRSADGGESWSLLMPGYTRAVWPDPADGQHLVAGPADEVDRGGTVVETRDGGRTWSPATDGLDTPWPETMVERLTATDDLLVAVLADGRAYVSPRAAGIAWRPFLPEVPAVNAVEVVRTGP